MRSNYCVLKNAAQWLELWILKSATNSDAQAGHDFRVCDRSSLGDRHGITCLICFVIPPQRALQGSGSFSLANIGS